MTKKGDVGKSPRTPAKHELMFRRVEQEVEAAHRIADIKRLLWFDLTAGDGFVGEGLRWEDNCSPGILARRAMFNRKETHIYLMEIKPHVFDELKKNLLVRLAALGYERVSENEWVHGKAHIYLINASGADASTDGIGRNDAVLALCDPNAITDWAMRPSFAQEVREKTSFFLGICTAGCNVGGLKRLSAKERWGWYVLVEDLLAKLHPWHDIVLAAIDRDDSQWAYFVITPQVWKKRTIDDVNTSFNRRGMTVTYATWRTGKSKFESILDRLFLTEAERREHG
jgi:hypothetical protein